MGGFMQLVCGLAQPMGASSVSCRGGHWVGPGALASLTQFPDTLRQKCWSGSDFSEMSEVERILTFQR